MWLCRATEFFFLPLFWVYGILCWVNLWCVPIWLQGFLSVNAARVFVLCARVRMHAWDRSGRCRAGVRRGRREKRQRQPSSFRSTGEAMLPGRLENMTSPLERTCITYKYYSVYLLVCIFYFMCCP